MEVPELLVTILLPIVGTLTAAVLGLLGNYLLKLRGQVKSKTLQNIIDVVGGVALTAVSDVMQNAVKVIKTEAADGKLTAAEAQAAFQKATQIAWGNLTSEVKKILTKEAGSVAEAKKRFVEPSISKAVLEAKTQFSTTLDKPREGVTRAQLERARTFLNAR